MNLECNHQTWYDDCLLLISPFPASHLTCLVLPVGAVGSDLTYLSSITSQSSTTPPNMLEMTWTVQVHAKHLDFLRSTDSEKTLVFSRRSMMRMSVFNSSVVLLFSLQFLTGAKFVCDKRTLHDHSWQTTVITLTICGTVHPYDQDDEPQIFFTTRHSRTHKACSGIIWQPTPLVQTHTGNWLDGPTQEQTDPLIGQ